MSRPSSYEPRFDVTPHDASHIRDRPDDELRHDPWAHGTRVYDIVATVANVPVTIRGKGSVSPVRGRGCRYHLDLELSSRTPVIGTRPEAFPAEQLDRTATGEPELGARWPAQRV